MSRSPFVRWFETHKSWQRTARASSYPFGVSRTTQNGAMLAPKKQRTERCASDSCGMSKLGRTTKSVSFGPSKCIFDAMNQEVGTCSCCTPSRFRHDATSPLVPRARKAPAGRLAGWATGSLTSACSALNRDCSSVEVILAPLLWELPPRSSKAKSARAVHSIGKFPVRMIPQFAPSGSAMQALTASCLGRNLC